MIAMAMGSREVQDPMLMVDLCIARVRRVPWTGRLAFGGQTYTVEVEPGVDVALVGLIAILDRYRLLS